MNKGGLPARKEPCGQAAFLAQARGCGRVASARRVRWGQPLELTALPELSDLTGQKLAVLRCGDEGHAAFIEMMRMSAQGAQVIFFDEMIDFFEEALAGRALGFTMCEHAERIPVPSLAAVSSSEPRLSYFPCYRAERAVPASDAAFHEFMCAEARSYW